MFNIHENSFNLFLLIAKEQKSYINKNNKKKFKSVENRGNASVNTLRGIIKYTIIFANEVFDDKVFIYSK